MKNLFPLICFVAIFLPNISFAGEGYEGLHGFRNPEVKKYIDEKVMPVLYEKRQILENELTPAEKSEIAECRSSLKTLRTKEHQLRKEIWAQKESADNAAVATDGSKEAFAEIHKQQHEIMQRLQKVADMHSTTLSGIRTGLEPLHKQWTDDLSQIRTTNNNGKETGYNHTGLPEFSLSGHHATTFFLLLEPASAKSHTEELKPGESASTDPSLAASLSSFSVWPNPASNEIVTGNEALPAENELALFDVQGRKVLSLYNVQAAQHLDVSIFPTGSYIIQLSSSGQAASRSIVISR